MPAKQSEINVAIAFSLQLVFTIVMLTISIIDGTPRDRAFTAVLTVITIIYIVSMRLNWRGK